MYQVNCSGYSTCTSGVQQYGIVTSLFCGSGVYKTQGIQADLEYIHGAIANQNGGNSPRRFLLQSVSGETTLQIQANMNVCVTFCVVKSLDSSAIFFS